MLKEEKVYNVTHRGGKNEEKFSFIGETAFRRFIADKAREATTAGHIATTYSIHGKVRLLIRNKAGKTIESYV